MLPASSASQANPRRGAKRVLLGRNRLRSQPASAEVTHGIGISGSRSFAAGEMLPAASLAMT